MIRPALVAGFWWRTPRGGYGHRRAGHIYRRGGASSVCGYAFEVPHRAPADGDRLCSRCAEPGRPRCRVCGVPVPERADGSARSHRAGRCAGIGRPTWRIKP